MEKQEVKSKWDELARQIGAEISPEIEQLVEAPQRAAAEGDTQHSYQTESGAPVAAPARPAAGWDNLASEFGLPIPEPPVEAALERAAPPGQFVEEPRAPAEEDVDRPSPDRRRPDHRDRSESRRESRGPRREDGRRRGHERSHQREERPQRRETHPRRRLERAPRTEEIDELERHESHDIAESTAALASSPPDSPPPPVEPAKPAAISLWHKIFGLPAEQTAKHEHAEQMPERPGDAPGSEESPAQRDDHFESTAIGSSPYGSEETLSTKLVDEAIPLDAESSPPDRNRSRRRRRGRGGRGRRADGDRDEGRAVHRRHHKPEHADARDGMEGDEAFHDHIADADDEDEHESGPGESDLDEDNASLAESGEGSVSRAKSVLQRSIPSWEEAIGYIIDVNMQGRSQRRQSGHSGARSSASRGRPRGRRRRS